jgi:hypothetical protein
MSLPLPGAVTRALTLAPRETNACSSRQAADSITHKSFAYALHIIIRGCNATDTGTYLTHGEPEEDKKKTQEIHFAVFLRLLISQVDPVSDWDFLFPARTLTSKVCYVLLSHNDVIKKEIQACLHLLIDHLRSRSRLTTSFTPPPSCSAQLSILPDCPCPRVRHAACTHAHCIMHHAAMQPCSMQHGHPLACRLRLCRHRQTQSVRK